MSEQVGQEPGRGPRIEEWLHSKGISGCSLCGQDAWKYDEVRTVIVLGARDVRDIGRESQERRIRTVGAGLSLLRSQLRGVRQAAVYTRLYELKCGNCGNVVLLDVKTVEGEAAATQPAEPE
jgi:hypothetical protein